MLHAGSEGTVAPESPGEAQGPCAAALSQPASGSRGKERGWGKPTKLPAKGENVVRGVSAADPRRL